MNCLCHQNWAFPGKVTKKTEKGFKIENISIFFGPMNFKNVKNLQHFRVCAWVMHPRRFSSTLVQSSLESYTHFCIFHSYILDKNYEYSNLERICTKIVDIFSVDEHFCMIYSIQRFCGFILCVLSANIAVKSSRNVHISSCWMTVYIIQWEDSHIKKKYIINSFERLSNRMWGVK